MSTTNKLTVQARDAQIVAGIQKHLQTTTTLALAGTPYSPADLVTLVQSRTTAATSVATAAAAWHAAVAAEKALDAKLKPVLRGLQRYVLNTYGDESPVLADFGYAPPTRKTPSPEAKVAAAAKAKATRDARHTMGKVQKKKVKGAVGAAAGAPAAPTAASPGAPTATPQGGAAPPHTSS